MIAMVLEEEYAKLDGAMAKRLTNLTSIPVRYCMHVLFYLICICFALFCFSLLYGMVSVKNINFYLTLLSFGTFEACSPD
jgi:hypothetical protein